MKRVFSLLIGALLFFSLTQFVQAYDYKPVIYRHGQITAPDHHAKTRGGIMLSAYLVDDDYDHINWAVRSGTCAAGHNTVYGNVDGRSDPYSWRAGYNYRYYFNANIVLTDLAPGMYCFVFNPVEDYGERDIRLVQEFYVAAGRVNGGGIITEETKPIEPYYRGHKAMNTYKKISFGGDLWDLGRAGYSGELEVNFHDVGNEELNRSKFHSTSVRSMRFFDGDDKSCEYRSKVVLDGNLNGKPGYTLVYRAGDSGSAAGWHNQDTVRFTLMHSYMGTLYDTHAYGEFTDESHCVGNARTGLDKGNVDIDVF